MTHIRLFHAVPNAPAVDVYLNGDLISEGLAYSKFTPYLPVEPGDYTVEIYPTGTSQPLILESDVTIPDDKIYTVAVIGLPSSPSLYPIEDPRTPLEPNTVGLRFGHLSPDAPNVDIRTDEGDILFENIGYKDVTDYKILEPGRYTIDVVPTGSTKAVLLVPNINLKGNRLYSIYAIGLVNMEPFLQVVIPLDGGSYIP